MKYLYSIKYLSSQNYVFRNLENQNSNLQHLNKFPIKCNDIQNKNKCNHITHLPANYPPPTRYKVPRVGIIITDGKPTINQELTVSEATSLYYARISLYAIGVTGQTLIQ